MMPTFLVEEERDREGTHALSPHRGFLLTTEIRLGNIPRVGEQVRLEFEVSRHVTEQDCIVRSIVWLPISRDDDPIARLVVR